MRFLFRPPSRFSSLLLAVALTCQVLTSQVSTSLAQRNLTQIPDVDPDVERQTFVMSAGLDANLFAGDPEIAKPIQINFDGQGRLWVAGSEIYPHILPGQKANDKILVLEDTNHDGVVDKKTVFADGLLIPTGVLPDEKGGCYVANSTELIYLKDTNGDGVADQRKVILDGFGTEDTHHLLHTLRWAPDGSLMMNQSIYIHSHVETPSGVKHLNGGGIWRFRPDTLELAVYCKGFVNPWGTGFDHWGQVFATDGAYGEGINYTFPDSVFVSSPGAKRIMTGLNPGSPKHCSLEVISGPHFPESWQGNMITNDFRANRVCRFVVTDNGSEYQSQQATEIIRSSHVAFRPIDAKLGPDGALYIADWYNPIIQHGEVDFRDPRRDHVHGRVWRVTMADRPLAKRDDLSTLTPSQLVDLLKDPFYQTRLWAKRYLRNHPTQQALQALDQALAETAYSDDPDQEHFRLEILWAKLTLDQLDMSLLLELTQSPVDQARAAAMRNAVQFLLPSQPEALMTLCQKAIQDPSPHVRLEAVCALGRLDSAEAAQVALQALNHPLDRNLDFALWNTLQNLAPKWLPLAQQGQLDFGDQVSHLVFALKAADSRDIVAPLLKLLESDRLEKAAQQDVLTQAASVANAQQLTQLCQWVEQSDRSWQQKVDQWQAIAVAARNIPADLPQSLQTSFVEIAKANTEPSTLLSLMELAARWQQDSAREGLQKLGFQAGSPEIQSSAISALTRIVSPNTSQADTVSQLLTRISSDRQQSAQARIAAAANLARLSTKQSASALTGLLTEGIQPPTSQVQLLLSQKGGQEALTETLKGQSLTPETARQLLADIRASAQPSDALLAQVKTCGDLANAGWKLEGAALQQFLTQVQQQGDPFAGEQIYRRTQLQCMNCHAIGGVGAEVGPDMISIGASAPVDYLLDSLLNPNAKVKEGYHSKLIQTIDGKIVSGIVVQQADGAYQLRQADNQIVRINEDDIEEIADGKSLMPEGLVDTLTENELRDLVCFLSKLGKEEPFAIRDSQTVRGWQVLPWNQQAHSRLNRTSFDTITTNEPSLQWTTTLPLVSGQVPLPGLPQYQIHANVPQTTFLRTRVEVGQGGVVRIQPSSTSSLQMWINQDPVAVKDNIDVQLATGQHWIYVAVDRSSSLEQLGLKIMPAPGSSATVTLPLKLDP